MEEVAAMLSTHGEPDFFKTRAKGVLAESAALLQVTNVPVTRVAILALASSPELVSALRQFGTSMNMADQLPPPATFTGEPADQRRAVIGTLAGLLGIYARA